MSIIEKGGLVPAKKRIVFLGDSITDDGRYIAHLYYYLKKYQPDHQIELINLGLSSETASGLSEPDHPFPRPCILERADRALALTKPDWVVICYGMNDGIYYPNSAERMEAYQKGMLTLIAKVKAAGAKAIVMTPPPFDSGSFAGKLLPEGAEKYSWMDAYEGYTNVQKSYRDWVMTDLRAVADRVVDIYTPMTNEMAAKREKDPSYRGGDGIHPDLAGHWTMARCLLGELFHIYLGFEPHYIQQPTPAFELVMKWNTLLGSAWLAHVGHSNPFKEAAMPLPEAQARADKLEIEIQKAIAAEPQTHRITDWKGHVCHDFFVNGRQATYIEPTNHAPGNPWVWRAEFFFDFNYADVELLKRGWGLCYYRVCNMFGCPESVELMKGFHDDVVERFGLSKTAAIFGFSRGGLYSVNYAAQYPEDIEVVYIDAPVLNIRSWPAGLGIGDGSPLEWKDCLDIYGLDAESAINFAENPMDKAETLVKANMPVMLVAGDADTAVPYTENGMLFDEKYRRLGGTIKTIVKPGIGHHPHSLSDPTEIVDFILTQTGRN